MIATKYFPKNTKILWNLDDPSFKMSSEYEVRCQQFLDFLSKNIKQPSVTPTSTTQETNAMNKITTAATTVMTAQPALHQKALVDASLLEVGKAVLLSAKGLIKPHIPAIVTPFIDHPFADLVLASGLSVVFTAVKPTDKKAQAISKAVLTVAYSKAIGSLEIPDFVSKLISSAPPAFLDAIIGSDTEAQ